MCYGCELLPYHPQRCVWLCIVSKCSQHWRTYSPCNRIHWLQHARGKRGITFFEWISISNSPSLIWRKDIRYIKKKVKESEQGKAVTHRYFPGGSRMWPNHWHAFECRLHKPQAQSSYSVIGGAEYRSEHEYQIASPEEERQQSGCTQSMGGGTGISASLTDPRKCNNKKAPSIAYSWSTA